MGASPTSRRPPKPSVPKVAVATFKDDPLFPRIERAVAAILSTSKVVTPIDVLIRMDILKPAEATSPRLPAGSRRSRPSTAGSKIVGLDCHPHLRGRIEMHPPHETLDAATLGL